MREFVLPALKKGTYTKLSFDETDMTKLIDKLFYLRNSLMRENVEIQNYILSPKEFLLFKYGTKYLTKYMTTAYSEFKNMTFCGVPILCGIGDRMTATVDDDKAVRMIEILK